MWIFVSVLLTISTAVSAREIQFDVDAAMAAAHANDKPVATPVATTAPRQAVVGETVSYGKLGDSPLNGYLAKPASASGDLPALIVIHEWWGLNDNVRKTAERWAAEGYVALAIDLYGGESATAPKEAMALRMKLKEDNPTGEANVRQAYTYLNDEIKAPRIGVIGWCMGGHWSLKSALLFPDGIDAMVMYYGSVITDEEQLATLQMPILGNFAREDPVIPLESVHEFRNMLEKLEKNVDIKIYANAKHAFSNPSGMAYNPEAAADAWNRSTSFLAFHLSGDGS